jgi:hypothetical protein
MAASQAGKAKEGPRQNNAGGSTSSNRLRPIVPFTLVKDRAIPPNDSSLRGSVAPHSAQSPSTAPTQPTLILLIFTVV